MRGATLILKDLTPAQVAAINEVVARLAAEEDAETTRRHAESSQRATAELYALSGMPVEMQANLEHSIARNKSDLEAATAANLAAAAARNQFPQGIPASNDPGTPPVQPAASLPFGIGAPAAPWDVPASQTVVPDAAQTFQSSPSTTAPASVPPAATPQSAPASPSPSASPAPAASTPPAGAPAGSPMTFLSSHPRDKDGVPHNPELHGPREGKTGGLMQTGEWKRKRSASVEAYGAWRDAHRIGGGGNGGQASTPAGQPAGGGVATAPTTPAAGNSSLNAMFGAPPVSQEQAAPPMALPNAAAFFGGVPLVPQEPDLEGAPAVDQATFVKKVNELVNANRFSQAIAVKIMTHPAIQARDEVDVGRDDNKRRKAFRLLELLEAGAWPLAQAA